ncbi:MAG: 5-formyltetrahydrofolate cyclo-ligase [Gammaproteobacteria bacterium]|jgi:5-formyltetrahydrofolate cyclo-ligase
MTQDLNKRKAALRESQKQVRDALPEEARREHSRAILERLLELPVLQAARSVFCFVSHGSEVDTHPLLDWLLVQGKTVAVPKILNAEGMIAVPFKSWDDLRPGQLGILTPAVSTPYPGGIDVCITPGLGFTSSGKRLGYGRGYYDRWFAGHPVAHRIAVGFECQLLEDLPAGERDVPVNMVVTERRIILID